VARDEGSMAGTAEVHVLFEGYVGEHTASTVALVRDGDATLIIDPGMVPDRAAILDPLRQLGVDPDDVTDVVFSHHHPDHTLHAALFPAARFHHLGEHRRRRRGVHPPVVVGRWPSRGPVRAGSRGAACRPPARAGDRLADRARPRRGLHADSQHAPLIRVPDPWVDPRPADADASDRERQSIQLALRASVAGASTIQAPSHGLSARWAASSSRTT
jgi:glyoxylase-like metal-dependent hydrolase (beta-lactamase superfamily II)